MLLYEQNQLEQAFDLAQQALHLIEQTGIVLFMEQSYVILIQIFLSRQQHDAAQEMLRRLSTLLVYRDNEYAQACLLSGLQVRLWLAAGKLQLAVQWRKQWQKLAPLQPVFAQERVAISQTRVLLAEQKGEEAHHLLTTWLPQARLAERKVHVLEMCLLEALAYQQMQRGQEALQVLAEALVIGESGGFVRHFLDEGAQLIPLLQRSRAHHGGVYVDRLLEAFEQEKQKRGKVAIPASFTRNQALSKPLSPREQEVLILLAKGKSNQEISEALVISLHTTKRHMQAILTKLDAHNRTEAVVLAQKLDLLPKSHV